MLPSNCRFLVSLHFQGGTLILTTEGTLPVAQGMYTVSASGLRQLVIQANQAFLLFSGSLCLTLSFLSSKPLVASKVLTPGMSTAPPTPEKILIPSLGS